MLGMEVIPAIAFIGLLFTVPESPRWLARRGRDDEARAILIRVDSPAHAEREMKAIRATATQSDPRFSSLFDVNYRRPLVLAVSLALFQQFCGINAIMYYSTKIFETAGAVKNVAFASSVWVGLINLVFTLVAIAFVDRLGRRPLLLIGTRRAIRGTLAGGLAFFHRSPRPIATRSCGALHRRIRDGHGADHLDLLLGDFPESDPEPGHVRGGVRHLGVLLHRGPNFPDAE
jgi:SP family arabinose:H+ symporter-like MFS transporter